NDVSRTRAQRSLLVVPDPRPGPNFGQPVCQSVLDGTDTSCIPADIFSAGNLSQAAILYSAGTGMQETTTEEQVVNASLNGPLGFTVPWAQDPVSVAVGAEYRFTSLLHVVDDVF